MHFLLNDLSLSGQFYDIQSFRESVDRVMKIRQEIQRVGSALYCNRKLAYAQVTALVRMQQAVQGFTAPERLALMQWITTNGPYWDDAQLHDSGDWLSVDGRIVTDSALGEAAISRVRGLSRELVSFSPSEWCFTPISVTWILHDLTLENVAVPNHWEIESVRTCLVANPVAIDSWATLAREMRNRCSRLIFAEDAFEPLAGHPFVPSAAERIHVLLHTLHRLKGCFDEDGMRTGEGDTIYNDHFAGGKAWFSAKTS